MKQRELRAATIRFEAPIYAALEEIARRECRTFSDEVRFLIKKALEQHGEERAA